MLLDKPTNQTNKSSEKITSMVTFTTWHRKLVFWHYDHSKQRRQQYCSCCLLFSMSIYDFSALIADNLVVISGMQLECNDSKHQKNLITKETITKYLSYLKLTEEMTTPDRCRIGRPIHRSNGFCNTIG